MIKVLTKQENLNSIFSPANIEEIIDWASKQKSISLDTETTGLSAIFHRILLLIIGDEEAQFVIDCRTTDKRDIVSILEVVQTKKVIAHNTKFDYSFIKQGYDIELRSLYCTMLGSQIIMNGLDYEHSLQNLIYQLNGKVLDKTIRSSFANKPDSQPFTEAEIKYAAEDIKYLKKIALEQYIRIKVRKQERLIELENAVTPVIANIELKGITLDKQKWLYLARNNQTRLRKVEKLMDRDLLRLSKKYQGLVGGIYTRKRVTAEIDQLDLFGGAKKLSNDNSGNINYGSTKQLKELYKRCGIDLEKIDEDRLLVFLKNNNTSDLVPFTEHLLYYKKIAKRISTYGESFLRYTNPITGNIHTSFTQCFTDTGRFSSGDISDENGQKLKWYVNFQNIPALQQYRSCFTTGNSDYRYITLDLSSAELVIAASFSQDDLVIKAVTQDLDLHSLLASKSYSIIIQETNKKYTFHSPVIDRQVTITKKDKKLRDDHKPVLFGGIYGAGATRVSEILDIPQEVAAKVLEGMFSLLPDVKKYLLKLGRTALSKGYVTANPITNRRRYFSADDIENKPWKVKQQACNMPIQATCADMIKMALVEIDSYLRSNKLDAWIVNTVHDEISIVAHYTISEQVYKDVKNIMESVANRFLIGVTMSSSGAIDDTWTK